jgi:hypothetical protein
MQQLGSQNQDHFDLLPFINILMCTLGCLLLVALSMAALSLGSAGEEWGFLASGDAKGRSKAAVLVEWDGALLIAHLDRDTVCAVLPPPATAAPAATPPATPAATCPANTRKIELAALMQYFTDRRGTNYALIAVRPSGFAKFADLQTAFADNKIEIGYEPIAQNKPVNLVKPGRTQ